MDHGEDEVLAISEKVVLRVEDLITWITVDAEWTWGRLAKCETDVKNPPKEEEHKNTISSLTESSLDFSDVEKEKTASDCSTDQSGPPVIILSYPRYCRYRAMMRRLQGVENEFLKYKIVNALGGFVACTKNTRILFCKDTFDYPELEGHELLCNHLAPKLKGRPRGRRKKRSVSPGSESNESESSGLNVFNSAKENIIVEESKNRLRCDSNQLRRSTRTIETSENKEFLKELMVFMKTNYTPIGKIPSLGYKELDLYSFYHRVQKLGGYDSVTANRLWKNIFDDLSGHTSSTSATTVIRRHYERFLLPYERHIKGEEYKPLPISERRRLKSKTGGSSTSDAETSESTSRSGNSTPIPQAVSIFPITPTTPTENKEFNLQVKSEAKMSSLRSVRVKPERQKDRLSIEKMTIVQNDNNNSESSVGDVTIEVKECDDKVVECEKVEVKECEVDIIPILPIIKPEPISAKVEIPEKDAEPVTSAVAPVAQKLTIEKSHLPVEEKEDISIIKTGDTPTERESNSPEVIEVPYKPKSPEIIDLESGSYSTKTLHQPFLHEVKKRKLDILKEGGLEVTPVRSFAPPLLKDARPSVIQPTGATSIQKTSKASIIQMPPPLIGSVPAKRLQLPLSQTPNNPMKSESKLPSSKSCSYVNGSGPPKVLQSKSIYSYSEKMVYGNPKDYMLPPTPIVHTPKSIGSRQSADILDLTVTSPQKPVVEIVKIPNPIPLQASFNSSARLPHKPIPTSPMLERSRIGSNLEITLVGSNSGSSKASIPSVPTPSRYTLPAMPHPRHHAYHRPLEKYPQKRSTSDYYPNHKLPRMHHENGSKYPKMIPSMPVHPVLPRRDKIDLTTPSHSYNNPRIPPVIKADIPKPTAQILPTVPPKHLTTPPVSFHPSAYLSHLYDNTKNLAPYMSFLDPVYLTAMQNLYSHTQLTGGHPIPPIPSPEQLKFYTDLMVHNSRMNNFPFPIGTDGNPSNNNFKKP